MILKLAINQYHLHGNPTFAWELISGITSFRYSKINKEQMESKHKAGINDYIQSLNDNGKVDEKNQNYIYIQAWHNRSLDSINIITNMVAFMLNDEGKTIERIN